MQLDELKEAWAAHNAAMERSLVIDERLLREMLLRKVRFAVAPYVLWRAMEVAIGIVVMFAVMPVLATHFGEPRYLVAGGAFAVFTAVITAMTAHLLIGALRLGYDGPVTAIQRQLEGMKLVEYRAFKWALLGGVVIWVPALLVLFEAVTGVDALARVDLAWLAANLILGLVIFAIGEAWSKRYVERSDSKPWARRFVDALSGRGLRVASGHLAELSRFVREERPGA